VSEPASEHVSDVALLAYHDGAIDQDGERAVEQHLRACGPCRARLSKLAEFDHFVHGQQPLEDTTAAEMFAMNERLLAAYRPPRVWPWRGFLLAAALLLGSALFWGLSGGGGGLEFVVHRAAEPITRSEPGVRLHATTRLSEAAWLAVFVRLPDGSARQLLPDGAPVQSAAGDLRLPANELLDWEFASTQAPSELLLVSFPAAPTADQLAEVQRAFAAAKPGSIPALATSGGRKAGLQLVPAR